MSTFYGNFTDNSKPSFQFDRIYPNYTIMRLLEKSDGIFIGRQVLIEYDLNPIDFFLKYASDSNFNDFFISKNISFSENNTIVEINGNTWTNNKTKEECYSLNETIDTTAIYDSTVWEKIYTIEDGQKYIKIANLNAVIPTLQINNINPTTGMEIISTGVPGSDYYKLDIPKNWNFGVKEIDYYEAPLDDSTITATTSDNINYIKVEPNGTIGQDANTQELSIHLPAIGNAVAKMNKVIAEMGTSNDPESNAIDATWWAKFKYFNKITQDNQFLTEAVADNKYLSWADATGTAFTDLYLTKADATSSFANYFTKDEINNSTTGFVRRDEINSLSSSIQQIEEDTSTTNNYASNNSWLDINRTNNNISIAHKKTQANYYDTNNQAIKYFGGATGNSSSYGGIPFFTPQFNIDAAGHITSITNHSYSITGSNWIENNQSYTSTGHVLNTISHKTQPQLEDKISEILEGETQPNIITYGGKINNDDDKIYIPSFNLDQAGHITDINNNSSLMDMMFYRDNEIINTQLNTFGIITSDCGTIYLNCLLPKFVLPGYCFTLDDVNEDIKTFIRILTTHNSEIYKCTYLYTGDNTDHTSIKALLNQSIYTYSGSDEPQNGASRTPILKISTEGCNLELTLLCGYHKEFAPTDYDNTWSRQEWQGYNFFNNATVAGYLRLRGTIKKIGTSIIRYNKDGIVNDS